MSYCIKCGKQNAQTAKFCTGCGAALITKTDQSAQPELIAKEGNNNNKKLGIVLIISLSVLAVAAGIYFIFFNNRKSSGDYTEIFTPQPPADTTAVPLPAPVDTTVSYIENPQTVSEAVPLNPVEQGSQYSITQAEVDNVSQILSNFYQCENNEDIHCLLNHYSFPLSRYYQLYNVSYNDLYNLFTESFNVLLYSHFITIKWEYSTVQKLGDGYKAVLYADYNFVRQKAPDENKSRSIQVVIFMNSSYKITHIYEN